MQVAFITDDFEVEYLAIGYLGAYLSATGHSTSLYKTNDEPGLRSLVGYEPDVLCYSVTTGYHNYYIDVHERLQELLGRNVLGIFGGPHPTFFPSYQDSLGNNVVIRGEGFTALVDAVNSVENIGIVDETILNIGASELRPQLNKENLLPPDRQLMYTYPANYTNPIKNVMCSFGCMFSCPYCYNEHYRDLYTGYTQRVRPLDAVAKELDDLQEYPLELIYFQDDLFPVFKKGWLAEFCSMYADIRVPFHVQLRAEFITDKTISSLISVGLHGVTFAVESGDSHFRQSVLQRKQTNETILNAAKMLRKYKIPFRVENMIGAPGEDIGQALSTVKLNSECKPTFGWASLFQPYPHTALGELAVKQELFDGDVDRISTTFSEDYLLNTLDKKKFVRLQRLFGLGVRYKPIRWLLPLLIKLPLTNLYTRLGVWFKGFSYSTRLYNVSRRTT